jgi:uncharacterized protein (TIGR02001 family)
MTSHDRLTGKTLGALCVLTGSLLACAPWSQALAADTAPAPDWTHAGNVTLVSDYIARGVSQTQGKPTLQATVDFTHASGIYVGLFGSGVSYGAYNNTSGGEIDVYGGYRHTIAPKLQLDVGVATYWFPGAHFTGAGRTIKYDTQELKLGLAGSNYGVTLWYTLSKYWFGYAVMPVSGTHAESRGSLWAEANWNPEIASGLVLNLHIGHQSVRNFGDYNFSEAKVGLTKTVGSWAFAGAVTHNNGTVSRDGVPYWTFFDADGHGEDVVGTRLLFSVARNF